MARRQQRSTLGDKCDDIYVDSSVCLALASPCGHSIDRDAYFLNAYACASIRGKPQRNRAPSDIEYETNSSLLKQRSVIRVPSIH